MFYQIVTLYHLSMPEGGPSTTTLFAAELKEIRRFDNVKKLTVAYGLDSTIIRDFASAGNS